MLRNLTLLEVVGGWTLLFTVVFGTIAFFMAPNDLKGIATYVATAVGTAPFFGALFAISMWGVIQVAA